MIFRWFKRRRRKKLLKLPFPEEWSRALEETVRFYKTLSVDEQKGLQAVVQVLVHEKKWEGCGGLQMTDEVKVNIAAQAGLLILNIEHDYYRYVKSILVYPSTFVLPESRYSGGIHVRGGTPVLGLAQHRGPVVLAWDEARHGSYNPADGRNVVFHEFAHKLDMLDDYADGTPPIRNEDQYKTWVRIMTVEYETLVEKTEKRRATLLDKYGAEEPAEFFAVATECFFEKPKPMKRRHPELYALLHDYYRQDPAERGQPAKRRGS